MEPDVRVGTLVVEEIDVGWQFTTEGFTVTAPTMMEGMAAFNAWLATQGTSWKVWRDESLEPGVLRWFVRSR